MNRFERDYVGHMVRQQKEDDLCHISQQVDFNHTSKSSIVDIVQCSMFNIVDIQRSMFCQISQQFDFYHTYNLDPSQETLRLNSTELTFVASMFTS